MYCFTYLQPPCGVAECVVIQLYPYLQFGTKVDLGRTSFAVENSSSVFNLQRHLYHFDLSNSLITCILAMMKVRRRLLPISGRGSPSLVTTMPFTTWWNPLY